MNTAQPARSTFVSVVAWIFIILSGFGTLIAILQNLMIAFLFPMAQMQQAMHDPHGPPMPPIAQLMFSHIQLLAAALLMVMVAALISSIGLLRRKNWARKLFIFFMALGVAWNVLGLMFQVFFFITPQAMEAPPNAPADFAGGFHAMMIIIEVATVAISLAFCALNIWIIKRLVSGEVKEEFGVYSYD